METIKIISLTNINSDIQNLDNFAIPISYIVNKNNHCNLPKYLYTNQEQALSDDKINDLIDLVNINKNTFKKYHKTTKKKNMKSNKSNKSNKSKKVK